MAGCVRRYWIGGLRDGARQIRHSRENGNPSDLRYVRRARSGGQAPALRAGLSRTGMAGCVRQHLIGGLRDGARPIRHSRENGNPSDLGHLQVAKSGGQAPALRAGMSRTGMAGCVRQNCIADMRIRVRQNRYSRERGFHPEFEICDAPRAGDKPPRYAPKNPAPQMRYSQWAL